MFYTESFFQLALEIINLNHDFRSTFETHPAILEVVKKHNVMYLTKLKKLSHNIKRMPKSIEFLKKIVNRCPWLNLLAT